MNTLSGGRRYISKHTDKEVIQRVRYTSDTFRIAAGKGEDRTRFQTLQDRLIKEMEFQGIATIPSANKYLKEEYIPRWNEKFSREARDKRLAYRTIATGSELRDILCIKEKLKVRSDNRIFYKGGFIRYFRIDLEVVMSRQR